MVERIGEENSRGWEIRTGPAGSRDGGTEIDAPLAATAASLRLRSHIAHNGVGSGMADFGQTEGGSGLPCRKNLSRKSGFCT